MIAAKLDHIKPAKTKQQHDDEEEEDEADDGVI
jgi:hypothetical protein